MVTEVEVCTRMYSLKLLESEREPELDVSRSIRIVCKLVMVMEPVIPVSHSEGLVPCHTVLLPFCEPVKLSTRLDEELHLHLLELPHAENELACNNLVPERLAYLRYSERNLHASSLLHIKIIHKYTLRCLRAQINQIGSLRSASELS